MTTRYPEDMREDLKKIAKEEYLDTSATIRKLLAMAIKEWKRKKALEKLRNHEISIGKAAEEAEISIWDMIELAKENKIDWTGYTQEDLERDLKT